jgi:hypothetical protein
MIRGLLKQNPAHESKNPRFYTRNWWSYKNRTTGDKTTPRIAQEKNPKHKKSFFSKTPKNPLQQVGSTRPTYHGWKKLSVRWCRTGGKRKRRTSRRSRERERERSCNNWCSGKRKRKRKCWRERTRGNEECEWRQLRCNEKWLLI